MTGVRCLLCGLPATAQHHLTGRIAPKGRYLDPSLVVPLCRRHHDREHELLRREGLEFPAPGADLIGHRVARVLAFMGRCGEHRCPFVLEPVTPYGDAVAALHGLLFEALGDPAPAREEVSA